MSKSSVITFRLNDVAKARLEHFCDLTGMKTSEVVKASLAHFMAPTLGNADCNTRVLQPSRAHENIKVNVSKDTCGVIHHENEKKEFFQTFLANIKRKLFPERISRAVKDQWNAITDWGKGPEEAARLYNAYLKNEQSKGRETCHPNAWIAGHGFLNEEERNDNGPRYDVDG
tara:strand:+ start:768 stop:1283 length:516 start_codon:yes stop_codon:yes gene_type:complete